MNTELRKHRFLEAFGLIIILLALIRCVFINDGQQVKIENIITVDTVVVDTLTDTVMGTVNKRYLADGEKPHRIRSVSSYKTAFPDLNDVQILAAQRWGVRPVKDREDAENRKDELVYVGCSPYYEVAPLYSSIPYLVPRAAVLLQDIGQSFFDSLQVKGVPLHRITVTSVLRSQADVARLRRHNGNATENSCHLYGTTFDISHTRYKTVQDPDGPTQREVRNDSLKFILSEVLNDMRQKNRCYVKYEVKQSCFHITVR